MMVQNRTTPTLVVTIIFFVLASIFVALRFVSRLGIVRKVVSHDYLILVAWVIDFGFVFAICYGTTKGLGLHQSDIPSSSNVPLNTSEYVANVLYNPTLMTLKTSILIFYLFLSKTNKVFRWAIFATIFVVNAAGVALTMVNIFQCHPVSAAIWFPDDGHAKCFSIVTIYLSSAPVNLITDIAIFFLPVPILTKLRLPRKQKIILIITFSVGFFTAVIDIIRVAYLQDAATSNAIEQQDGADDDGNSKIHQDFSWYGAFTLMWSAIEINTGIICACVPSLKPLAARLLPRMIKGSTETSSTLGSAIRPPAIRAETAPLAFPQAQAAMAGRMAPRAYTDQGPLSLAAAPVIHQPINSPSEELLEMNDILARSGPSDDTENSTTTGISPSFHVTRFFDFVNVKKPKSMLAMSNKESIPPVALATTLFFLWGFGYGFLDILNAQFALIDGISTWGSLGLHAAYYGGYLVSPLTIGRTILKKWGFKATFIAGLFIYACGALIFWPSAVLTSFPAFVISNFFVGCAFGILETAANPFIALCGPMENAEMRLNISQAIQATGSVLSALLSEKVLFKSVISAASLVRVQWTYLAIALFDLLLAAAFYYLPVPEATEEDLQESSDRRKDDNSARVVGIPVIWLTFGLAVFSQFWYVGSQEALAFSFAYYVQEQLPNGSSSGLDASDLLSIARGMFAFGRFVAAFANIFFKPRWILSVSYIGLIVFAVLAKELHGLSGVVIGMMLFFWESGVFSITFAISLRGMGRHTKTAGAIMATAVGGGAICPFFQAIAQTNNHNSVASSYVVLAVGYAAASIFPLYLMIVPAAKKQVDPVLDDYLHRRLPLRGQRSRKRPSGSRSRISTDNVNGNSTKPPDKSDHYSLGGVLSRPRSFVDGALSTVNLAEPERSVSGVSVHDQAYEHERETSSGSTNY